MLESFRNASQSWPIKILFGMLILAFGVWGIGDVVRNRATMSPAITVGHRTIGAPEVADEFRRDVDHLSAAYGNRLNVDQARRFGLLQRTIQQMVTRNLLDQAATSLGITVDDDTLRDTIRAMPAFQNELHTFDANYYHRAIAHAGYTESRFIAMERGDIVRQELVEAVESGVSAPSTLVEALFRYRNERRVADVVTFAADKLPAPAKPDEPTLRQYQTSHADRFMAPEMRTISVLSVRLDDIAATIQPSEEDIEKSYQVRAAEFQTAKKTQASQVMFDNEDQARDFAVKATAKDFADAAKEAGKTPLDLGWVEKKDVPLPELADALFAADKPGIVGPVHSTLGWHVLSVTGVEPAKSRSLAEVRDEIVKSLAKDEATNRLYALSTKMEDAVGSGAGIEEAATTLGLHPLLGVAVDNEGKDADGKVLGLAPDLLLAAFQTAERATTEVTQYRDGAGYFVLHVDKVTPAAEKSFEMAKDAVLAAWTADQRAESSRKLAEAAVGRVRAGEPLAAVAGAFPVATTKPLQRFPDRDSQTPPVLAAEMFKLAAVGDVAVVTLPDGTAVARLKEIIPADPAKSAPAVARMKDEMSQTFASELVQAYVAAEEKNQGVSVNTALIDRQFDR
jgi:peptidyl-prolyl cis-trans isomerase D